MTTLSNENEALDALTSIVLPLFENERPKLDRLDRWWRWNPQHIRVSGKRNFEHVGMRNMGETPWLGLVVTTLAQTLYLEGVDVPNDTDTHDVAKRVWLPWQRNGMRRRQIALHREAIAYGSAYAAVSYREIENGDVAVIDCWSPRDSLAVYTDPAKDVFPELFMRRRRIDDVTNEIELWDDHNVFVWAFKTDETRWTFEGSRPHGGLDADGRPVCPVVRYANQMDLQGRTPGEVEPYIRMASRLNKDNYDRLLAQHYNSWKVKTATGLDMSNMSDSQREEQKLKIAHEDVLAGGDGVQFGTLPETSLDNLVNAKQSDVEELAAVSQTPTTAFGKMVNVGDAGIEETAPDSTRNATSDARRSASPTWSCCASARRSKAARRIPGASISNRCGRTRIPGRSARRLTRWARPRRCLACRRNCCGTCCRAYPRRRLILGVTTPPNIRLRMCWRRRCTRLS